MYVVYYIIGLGTALCGSQLHSRSLAVLSIIGGSAIVIAGEWYRVSSTNYGLSMSRGRKHEQPDTRELPISMQGTNQAMNGLPKTGGDHFIQSGQVTTRSQETA